MDNGNKYPSNDTIITILKGMKLDSASPVWIIPNRNSGIDAHFLDSKEDRWVSRPISLDK